MSFLQSFNRLPLEKLLHGSMHASQAEVEQALGKAHLDLTDFSRLISPAAREYLEPMGRRAQVLSQQRFGKVIRLFAPLYLSNECINNCSYCGFSRDNPILRVTLSVDEVITEAQALVKKGFRNILLVAGEHPRFVSEGYLQKCIKILHDFIPGISLEVGPMETEEYNPLAKAGCEGLVVYQETYDRPVYSEMHTAGPKKDFDWRLATPERAYHAGFRRLGIGALLGLGDWRWEALSVAAHAQWLLKHCWKAQLTISMPRLRPCAGEFEPLVNVSDAELAQLICALRMLLPDVGIVLSTREPARLRNGLMTLGVTHMSAGSHTEPGGYTGAGKENLHLTERGRITQAVPSAGEWATGQFDIADDRTPAQVATQISNAGYEPVWKDWDAALTA
ncbi:MAG: 2-iminoacetate synthase ThiH [Verrucomicrobiales bacterium]|nr:2-iminoacetate synthase ThiH [Verrucomicrobiales bacterium]